MTASVTPSLSNTYTAPPKKSGGNSDIPVIIVVVIIVALLLIVGVFAYLRRKKPGQDGYDFNALSAGPTGSINRADGGAGRSEPAVSHRKSYEMKKGDSTVKAKRGSEDAGAPAAARPLLTDSDSD
jgi:flagellar basal body-associated protein FliL